MKTLPLILADAGATEGVSLLQFTARSSAVADVMIYGMIGESLWGESLSATTLVEQIRASRATTLNVRINSRGGVVSDGLAIYHALKDHAARKIVWIDGQACSIASLIAMAGDEVVAYASSLFMVHAPSTAAAGHASAFREYADALDVHAGAMLPAYVAKTGKEAEVRQLLTDGSDHWYTAQQAKAFGFVDRIDAGEAEPRAQASSTVALGCYVAAIERAPHAIATALRGLIARAASIEVFASLSPSFQNAVIGHIEDSTMKQSLLRAVANAGGAAPAPSSGGAEVLAQLRERNNQISEIGRSHIGNAGVQAVIQAALIDPAMSLDQVYKDVLAALAANASPLGGSMFVSSEHAVPRTPTAQRGADFVHAVSDSLLMRSGITPATPHAGVSAVRGMSLTDIMRACIYNAGRGSEISTNTRGFALVNAAMSTSDFPSILQDTLRKALRNGYEAEPATFRAWSTPVTVPDFKDQSRVLLGSAPELLLVPEGAEYKEGSMDEDKSVPYRVQKFGRLVSLTWEAIVNDDLGAFLRITQAMGQAALRKEADTVYAMFTENGGGGPTMQDGEALFHADHANLATSAAAINAASLGAARLLLRKQTAFGGGVLNLTPRFLLVPPVREQEAELLLAAARRAESQGADNKLLPQWLATLELVVEARLGTGAFYLLTAPSTVDTVEVAHLDEDGGPTITEEEAFKSDVRTYKVRDVFAARWLDWRGAVKNPLS